MWGDKLKANRIEYHFAYGWCVKQTRDRRLNSDQQTSSPNFQLDYFIDRVSVKHHDQCGISDGQTRGKPSTRRKFPQRLQLHWRSKTYFSGGQDDMESQSEEVEWDDNQKSPEKQVHFIGVVCIWMRIQSSILSRSHFCPSSNSQWGCDWVIKNWWDVKHNLQVEH